MLKLYICRLVRCVFVVVFIYLFAERGGLAEREIIYTQNIKTSLSRR